jgi:glyoxylase-like metal-dependent hydrolase (beta-lactamase superfamily II)
MTREELKELKLSMSLLSQADAILLEFKNAAILVDAGAELTADEKYEQHFLSDLDALFQSRPDLNKTLRAVIVTHPHIDHTRLLMDVFQHFTVKNFGERGFVAGQKIASGIDSRDDLVEDADVGSLPWEIGYLNEHCGDKTSGRTSQSDSTRTHGEGLSSSGFATAPPKRRRD